MEELSLLDSNLNSRSSESFIPPAGKSGSSFANRACRAVDCGQGDPPPQLLPVQFLRRDCARLLWLFYFHWPDLVLHGDGRTAPEAV